MKSRKFVRLNLFLCVFLLTIMLMNPLQVSAVSPANDSTPYANYTTEQLIQEILSSSYTATVYLANSADRLYSYLYNNYSIFHELEIRSDATEVLTNIYYHLLELYEATPSSSIKMQIDFLNAIMQSEQYITTFSNQSQSTYSSSNEPVYANGIPYYLTDIAEFTLGDNKIDLYYTNKLTSDYDFSYSESLIYDQCGTLVKLADHNVKYNCHSYAWYQRSTYNQYCLFDINPYINDSHYYEVSKSSAKVDDVVVYYSSSTIIAHSAIITSVSTGSSMVPIINCKSKMGACGVYQHGLENVPDAYMNNGTVDYKIYRYSTDHTYTGTCASYSDTHHTTLCAYCDAAKNTTHTTTTTYTTLRHTKTCTACGWSKTETHTFVVGSNKCTGCNYVNDEYDYINRVVDNIVIALE